MRFVDSVDVKVVAGNGGNGSVAFRREKFIPHGGPAGGDGGKGGDIVFVTDPGLSTLLDLAYRHTLRADHGEPGRGKDQYGRGGKDLVVRVPVGTIVHDAATGDVLADLVALDRHAIVARGGRGGRGNIHFASSTERAPRRSEPGEPGEERNLRLELKVLADVGLVGFPNVGKSTFVRASSKARAKVADYPFTTLTPQLGVVQIDSYEPGSSFVLADIPGLVPGASRGLGLGHQFLRHVERTRALLHLVTIDPGRESTLLEDFDILTGELRAFDPELAKRPTLVAVSKGDLPDARAAFDAMRPAFRKRGIVLRLVSAATGEGMKEILRDLLQLVRGKTPPRDAVAELEALAENEAERPKGPPARATTTAK